MTEPTPETEGQPWIVEPTMGSRLEALHEAYADAKAKADAANEALKAITDGIKAILAEEAPDGETRIRLESSNSPPLQLTYSESWRLDSTRLKREHTELWVAYAKKSGSWSLRSVGGA